MDQNRQTLIDQRPFSIPLGRFLIPLWCSILRDGAINAGFMQWPNVVTGPGFRHQSSNYEGICEQEPTELHVRHPGSNTVAGRPFSQDWKDMQDRVSDALTTYFLTDRGYSS
jgi:hypothetical protein